jgi:hypothetical protein
VTLKADAVDEFDIDVAAVNPDQFEQDIAGAVTTALGLEHAKPVVIVALSTDE